LSTNLNISMMLDFIASKLLTGVVAQIAVDSTVPCSESNSFEWERRGILYLSQFALNDH
jgi:hypothetical protein